MPEQSTNHIFMIEPAEFFANPQTMDTNVYQDDGAGFTHEELLNKALREFRDYRDALVKAGVVVTTAYGLPDCPDMVFPNWMSLHTGENDASGIKGAGTMFLYPMLNENRRAERSDDIIRMLKRGYPIVHDWRHFEDDGLILESTASICMDRVNKRGFAGLSGRTDRGMVEKWCDVMGYTPFTFTTHSHAGKPVYHTDYLMYIGTDMAAICLECFDDQGVAQSILAELQKTHEVIELTMEQQIASCGNALEVVGLNGERMLTMSDAAIKALRDDQLAVIRNHYNTLITSPLYTLEKYGGGSARCMLMELF